MSIRDFKAKQLRTTSIIGSGSNVGSEPSVLIYSASAATDSVGSRHSDLLTNIGTDVFLFVSGSKTTDSNGNIAYSNNSANRVDTAVFGGDLVVSGVLYAEVLRAEVDMATTGSLTVEGPLFVTGSSQFGNGPAEGHANDAKVTIRTELNDIPDKTLYIDHNTNDNAIKVDAANTTGYAIDIEPSSLTSGRGIYVHSDSDNLNGAQLGYFESNSTSTDDYKVLEVAKTTTNGSDTNTIVGLEIDFNMTAGTAGRALRIDSEQTTGIVAEIDADALTTGTAVDVSTDARTTGTALSVSDSATNDNAGSLVKIAQTGNRAGSAASIGLEIDFNTVANSNARALKIDSEQTTGVVAEFDGYEITTGDVVKILADDRQTGSALHVNDTGNGDYAGSLVKIVQAGARNGTAASIGLEVDFNTVTNPAARALKIDSEQTTGVVAEIDGNQISTGTVLVVSGTDVDTTGHVFKAVGQNEETLISLGQTATGERMPQAIFLSSSAVPNLDVSFFVSGSTGDRGLNKGGISLFAGDVVISGSLTDGDGNPIAGGGTGTVTSGSFNEVTVSGETASFVTTASLSIAGGLGFEHDVHEVGTDVYFFVSGAVGEGASGATGGKKAVFGGDTVVSGAVFVGGSLNDADGTAGHVVYEHEQDKKIRFYSAGIDIMAGSGGAGSGGEHIFVSIADTGQKAVNINAMSEDIDFNVKSDVGISLTSHAATHQLSLGDGNEPAGDTFLFVSGAINSRNNTAISGSAVFGGDLVVSGVLYGDRGAAISTLNKEGALIVNTMTDQVLVLSGSSSDDPFDEATGADVAFYVSGTVGSRGTSERGTSLFGGDVAISGSLFVGQLDVDSQEEPVLAVDYEDKRVGIGTSSPTYALDVVRSDGTLYDATTDYTGGDGQIRVRNTFGTVKSSTGIIFSNSSDGATSGLLSTVDPEQSSGADVVKVILDAHRNDGVVIRGKRGTRSHNQVLILSGGSGNSFNEAAAADVAFYVSGAIDSKGTSQRGTSVFGGDTVISGALYLEEMSAPGTIADGTVVLYGKDDGGVTKLYFKNENGETEVGSGGAGGAAVSNVGWLSPANQVISTTGSVKIGTSDENNADIHLGSDGAAIFNDQGAAVDFRVESDNKENAILVDGSTDQVLILSGGAGASFDEASGGDVAFYVSGSTGTRGTSERGTSVFGGDLFVSGNQYIDSTNKIYFEDFENADQYVGSLGSGVTALAAPTEIDLTAPTVDINASTQTNVSNDLAVGGNLDIANNIRQTGDVANYIQFGTDILTFNVTNTQFVIDDVNDRISVGNPANPAGTSAADIIVQSEVAKKFLVHAKNGALGAQQVLILSGGGGTSPNEADYTDLAFFVSGAIGSAGTAERGTSVFGGDVVISGTLSGGSPLIIDGDIQVSGTIDVSETTSLKATALSGSLTHLQDGTSYLIAGSNVTITTGSNGAVTIASTATGGGSAVSNVGWLSPANQVISTTGSLKIGTADENNPDIDLGSDGSAVFNEQGASVDFRVESDNKTHAIFVDGSTNQVLILSGGAESSLHATNFADTNFFVSGAIGSRGTATRGTSVFGGDMFVSGGMVVGEAPTETADGSLQDFVVNTKDAAGIINVSGQNNYIQFRTSDSSGQLSIGQDTFFHVSGTIGGKDHSGVAVFGGDVVVSGNILTEQPVSIVNNSTSTDALLITSTENGSTAAPIVTLKRNSSSPANADYLGQFKFKGENDNDEEIVYAKITGKIGDKADGAEDGIIEFTAKNAGSNTIVARVKNNGFAATSLKHLGDSSSKIDFSTGQVLMLSGGSGNSFDEASGADVAFYVSGSIGKRGTSERGTAVFGGDLFTSGTLYGEDMHVGESIFHSGDTDTKIVFADDAIGITVGGEQLITVTEAGQDIVKIGDGGDVDFQVRTDGDDNTLYVQGSSDRVGIGTNSPASVLHIKESAPTLSLQRESNSNDSTLAFLGSGGSTGAIMHLSSSNDIVFKTHDGTSPHEIMRLGGHWGSDNRQIILLSGSAMAASAMQPKDAGDIAFFVSGAIGKRGGNEKGAAVFGGDLVTSGTTHALGILTAPAGLSGSITQLSDGTSYIKAGSNITITSASNGAITIASTGGAGAAVSNVGWLSPANQVISTTGSLKIGTSDENNPDINLGSDGSAVFNEQGASVDFRIESDNLSHMVFVDGSANQVAIGAPSADITSNAKLVISSSTDASLLTLNVNTPDVARTNSIMSVISGSAYVFNLDKHGKAVFNPDFANQANPTVPTDVTFFVSGSNNVDDRHTAAGGVALFGGNIVTSGSIIPGADSSVDLGSTTNRFRNVYTGDLHLRNDRGDWTIVEERDYLCVVNNITGKKYKMDLTPLED